MLKIDGNIYAHFLGGYVNGNYNVIMLSDGTKVRFNDLDQMTPAFPESIDLKICNRCDMNCKMCHECSTPDGDLADLNAPFLDTLIPYTELAIGGGNPLEHPELDVFLRRMKEKRVICNMTVHYLHFQKSYDRLLAMSKEGLIHGLGISVSFPLSEEEVQSVASFPNAVVHVIAGVTSLRTIESLADHHIKMLILGYKVFGRGAQAVDTGFFNMDMSVVRDGAGLHRLMDLRDTLPSLFGRFDAISFDNLAIKQLNVKKLVSDRDWDEQYMGDDGQFTMYIDLVKREYAISSVSERHAFTDESITKLFGFVRAEAEKKERE